MNTLARSMNLTQQLYGTINQGNGPIFPLERSNLNTDQSTQQQQPKQNNYINSDSQIYGTKKIGEGKILTFQQGNLPLQQNPLEQQSRVSVDVFGTGEAILFQQEQQNQQENELQISNRMLNGTLQSGSGFNQSQNQQENDQFGTQQIGTGFNIQNQLQNQLQNQPENDQFGTQQIGTGFNIQNPLQIQQSNPENNDLKTYRKKVYSKLPQSILQSLQYDVTINFLNQITYNTQNFQLKNYDDNNFYEGELLNGKKHGYGFHFQGKEFYDGYFENDKRQGKGVAATIDFDYFIGNWYDNNLVGQVQFKNKQNQFYDGWCKKNLVPHGKGTLEIQKQYKYNGDFVEGKMHGQGQKDCYIESKLYIGSFVSNKMQGKGKIKYQNGKEYVGEFKNNKYDGEGILKDSDGSIYIGQFKNNFKNGYGRLIQANQEIIEGYWVDDEKQQ